METVWVRTGGECRLTIAQVSAGNPVKVIDYIIWVRDLYVGNVKFCPVGHIWGIKLCPYVIVTQAFLDTIWAKFHSLAPHVVLPSDSTKDETDV